MNKLSESRKRKKIKKDREEPNYRRGKEALVKKM
jgi:hypothetical protein